MCFIVQRRKPTELPENPDVTVAEAAAKIERENSGGEGRASKRESEN
ncbi:hypothetical protein L195_g040321 [Trifolium pratense]|uniref:Uncharacterized protein n=1 Tax=Trifolium pratense TaxID=57577 RepID=A0A2K3M0F2_TRIPR|nr:hypothetical protein L195_g040321 [Trifolium pratense]